MQTSSRARAACWRTGGARRDELAARRGRRAAGRVIRLLRRRVKALDKRACCSARCGRLQRQARQRGAARLCQRRRAGQRDELPVCRRGAGLPARPVRRARARRPAAGAARVVPGAVLPRVFEPALLARRRARDHGALGRPQPPQRHARAAGGLCAFAGAGGGGAARFLLATAIQCSARACRACTRRRGRADRHGRPVQPPAVPVGARGRGAAGARHGAAAPPARPCAAPARALPHGRVVALVCSA